MMVLMAWRAFTHPEVCCRRRLHDESEMQCARKHLAYAMQPPGDNNTTTKVDQKLFCPIALPGTLSRQNAESSRWIHAPLTAE